MWRFDAERSAASPHALPGELHLLWERQFLPRQQAWDDPLNLDLMTYDRVLEPIVVDGRLMVAFNDKDKVVALDTATGLERWTVYAEAPVRLPPAADDGKAYFCSDDGFLYCVEVATGELRWKFSGAPSAQHAIGNRRFTSAWPARGGPVIRDKTVYFAASIWPFMGTFVYALDAESGAVTWVNDRTGSQYIKQPHSAPSFAGVAPQGALVATEDLLVVPGGRSVPAVFERGDGALRYFEINAGGKGTGGSFVAADANHFYVHTREKGTRAFHLADGVKTAFMPNEPVLQEGRIYSAEVSEDDQPVIRAYGQDEKLIWELEADGRGDLILAGDQLVAAGGGRITLIDLPNSDRPARVASEIETAAGVERLLAADSKLFAVTLDGRIMAFGPAASAADNHKALAATREASPLPRDPNESRETDRTLTQILSSGTAEGYGLWFGRSDSALAMELATQSPFEQLAIVDPDAEAIDRTRRRLDQQDLYRPVTIHHSEAGKFKAPKYVANMVMVDRDSAAVSTDSGISDSGIRDSGISDSGISDSGISDIPVGALYESVRPFGGVLCLIGQDRREELAEQIKSLGLEQAEVEVATFGVIVRRKGALPGSDDWTHQYGNVANTIKSDDRRVRLPLGLLWFGGSSNTDVLPRHGHGPPEQVVGGRLFIQGMNTLSARDVYTGRVLWKREFNDLGTFDVYYDDTYEDTPLDPKYNQVHIPGANGRGTNYVVTEDRVYLVEGRVCHILDPATGETLSQITMPGAGTPASGAGEDQADDVEWGYIGVYQDVLIGGRDFAEYRSRYGLAFEEDKKLTKAKEGFGAKSFDRAASSGLVGFDRYSGEVLWQFDANHSFWHNGIVAGGEQVYCLDRNPARVEQALLRRGVTRPETYRIVALNYRTGELNWEIRDEIFGTWLSYSEEFDLLLQAGASASDRLTDEVSQGMAVYSASDGSVKWHNKTLKYTGPCILHHDWIITNTNSYSESAGAFFLLDGRQKLVPNPITGQMQPWKLTRAYGCNNIIASENLLTFRSGSAGFYDLLNEGGTGNLGGFKSGCTSNLVVANGVLNAPDYTRTCSCAYQNQTSLALVHMPDIELWSVDTSASVKSHGKRIESLGINFGAPGDRRDGEGRLWIEYPAVSGESPPIALDLDPAATLYQHHSSVHAGQPLSWVLASGAENVTDIRLEMKLQDQYELSSGIPVIHADDDAEEADTGQVSLDSSDLELVKDSSTQLVGLRFNNIQLAQDSVIRSAFLQFTCDEPSDEATSLIIAAEDTGSAARFSQDNHDLSSRTMTSAEVFWEPEPWKKSGDAKVQQRTPDLAPLIRAVIARPDWKPGNSIAFLISGSGKRTAAAFQSGNSQAAVLVVDAEPGSVAAARESTPLEPYRLRLLFGLPPQGEPRVFDVIVQGKTVRRDLRLAHDSPDTAQASEMIPAVMIGDELQIQLVPKTGLPLLSGLELVRQGEGTSQ